MAETHVISALTNKRGELLGEIKHYEAIIKEYKDNLSSIDKTIHIFDKSYNLSSVKSKRVMKNRYFKNGETVTLLLDTLRKLNRPTRTDELSEIIANGKGLSFESDHDRANFQKIVVAALSRMVDNGLIERVGRDGLTVIWKIKEIG